MSLPISPDLSVSPASSEAGLSREAYTLLAQANLLRMRGRWDDAIKCCMAAMQLSPENATAQSLLGDIYDNRGCIDDAIQWYRMALDVNPESPADKLKLARLLEAKGRLIAMATPSSSPIPAPITPRAPRPARPSTDPYVWMRAVLASALVGLALVAIALFFVRRPSSDLAALASARELSTKPLILPAVEGSASTLPVDPPSSVNLPSPVTPPQVDTRQDPAEISLVNTLQSAAPLTAEGIVVTDAQIDPRNSRVTLTLVCHPDPALSDIHELVLRDAQSTLVQAAQVADPGISQFTVRCLMNPNLSPTVPGGDSINPSLVFVGDTTRSAIAGYDSSLPVDITHLQSLYTNPWWLPSLPAPTTSTPAPVNTPASPGTI